MNKNKLISLLLLLTMSCIIFSFSMQIADVSNNQSGFIVNLVLTIFVPLFGNIFSVDTLTHIVRKTAHFAEYSLLGILGANANRAWKDSKYSNLFYIYGILNAILDETIQYFTPGRSCQISDMILDSCGYLFGYIFLLLCIYMIKKYAKSPHTH